MSTPARLSGAAGALDAGERAVVDLAALLDQRGELGGGDGVQLGVRGLLGERRGVGAAVHGRRRGDQADPAVARWRPRPGATPGRRRRPPAPGARARRAARAAPPRWPSCRRPRAAWRRASSRMPASSRGERAQLVRRAVAVGKARGVAEVEEVLVRKRHEALVQNGEPADAGVEDGDGQGAIGGSPRAPMVARAAAQGAVGGPPEPVEPCIPMKIARPATLPTQPPTGPRLRTAPSSPPP